LRSEQAPLHHGVGQHVAENQQANYQEREVQFLGGYSGTHLGKAAALLFDGGFDLDGSFAELTFELLELGVGL